MNVVQVAVMDAHPFKSPDHCPACKALFFARSREKWENLQAKWEVVRQRMLQTYQADPQIVAAIMTRDPEGK